MVTNEQDSTPAAVLAAYHVSAPQIAVVVRKGQARVERVTYDARGISTITPLTVWMSPVRAQAMARTLRAEQCASS